MKIEFTLMQTLKDVNLTRSQLSEMTGIRKNTISDICAGRTARIHTDVIERILVALYEWTNEVHGIDSIFVFKADK